MNAFIQSKNKTHTVNNKKEKISFLSSLSRSLSRSHSSVRMTIQMHHLFRYKLYISSKLANFIIDRFGFDAFFYVLSSCTFTPCHLFHHREMKISHAITYHRLFPLFIFIYSVFYPSAAQFTHSHSCDFRAKTCGTEWKGEINCAALQFIIFTAQFAKLHILNGKFASNTKFQCSKFIWLARQFLSHRSPKRVITTPKMQAIQ